jgi:hypothetical protein
VKNPVIAVRRLAKRLDDVAFVVDALVAKSVPVVVLLVVIKLVIDPVVLLRLVIVPVAAVREEIVVVASVEVPVTPNVPATVSLPNTVEVPTYDEVAYELTAKTLRKRLANVPSERVPVVVGKMSADRLTVLKNDD